MIYIVFITRNPLTVFRHVPLPYTPYSTLPMESKQWDQCGLTGRSQWSGSVGNCCVASKAGVIHSQTLILISQRSRNWIKSKTDTRRTPNLHCSLKRKWTHGSLVLMNVRVYKRSPSFSSDIFHGKIPHPYFAFHGRENQQFRKGFSRRSLRR